jgi:diacylglycerol kinase family enzyme
MIAGASAAMKQRLGMLSYVVSAARGAARLEAFRLQAMVDGDEIVSDAILALILNAGSVFGGLLELGPGIKPDDGLLDLCILSPSSRVQLMDIAQRVLRGNFEPHAAMKFIKARQIKLVTDPPRQVQADGDLIGSTPIEATVLPGAALFLVPE